MDINTYISAMGFIGVVSDSCMYVRGSYAIGTLVIIILYVDDMGIAAQPPKILNQVKIGFMTKWSIKDLGAPNKMLGMQIN